MLFSRCLSSSSSAIEAPATPPSTAEFSPFYPVQKSQQEAEGVEYQKDFHKKQIVNTDDMAAEENEEAAILRSSVGKEGGGDGGAAFSLSSPSLNSTRSSQGKPPGETVINASSLLSSSLLPKHTPLSFFPCHSECFQTQTLRCSQNSTPTAKKIPEGATEDDHKQIGEMIPQHTGITDDDVMAQCSKRMRPDESINHESVFPSLFSLPTSAAAYIGSSSSSSDSNSRDTCFYTSTNGLPSSSSSWIPPTSAVLVSIPTDFCTAGGRPICVKQWRAVRIGEPLSSTMTAVSPKYNTMNSSDTASGSLSMTSKSEEVSRSVQDEVPIGVTDSLLNDKRDAEVRGTQELEKMIDLDLPAQWERLSRCVTAADSALSCQAVYEAMCRRDESVGEEK